MKLFITKIYQLSRLHSTILHQLSSKGIYNRLVLTKCYLLDINLALYVPWLLYQVKFNKSWIYFFIMENCFYSIQRKDEKSSRDTEARTCDLLVIRLAPQSAQLLWNDDNLVKFNQSDYDFKVCQGRAIYNLICSCLDA